MSDYCPICNGTGVETGSCPACHGQGTREMYNTVKNQPAKGDMYSDTLQQVNVQMAKTIDFLRADLAADEAAHQRAREENRAVRMELMPILDDEDPAEEVCRLVTENTAFRLSTGKAMKEIADLRRLCDIRLIEINNMGGGLERQAKEIERLRGDVRDLRTLVAVRQSEIERKHKEAIKASQLLEKWTTGAGDAQQKRIMELIAQVERLREALAKLLNACEAADNAEELSGYVDGSMLDVARAALEVK